MKDKERERERIGGRRINSLDQVYANSRKNVRNTHSLSLIFPSLSHLTQDEDALPRKGKRESECVCVRVRVRERHEREGFAHISKRRNYNKTFESIQIMRDTFLFYFRPPPNPM